jgi:hypothetical protein
MLTFSIELKVKHAVFFKTIYLTSCLRRKNRNIAIFKDQDPNQPIDIYDKFKPARPQPYKTKEKNKNAL